MIENKNVNAIVFSEGMNCYRYAFQGQEVDNELWAGAVSYKYRMEDPRLGRFFSVDPLAAKYPHNSVYAFSENRVVDGVELEGLEYEVAGKYEKGTYIPPQDNLVSRYNLDNYVRADYFQVDPPMDITSPRSIADNISPVPSDESYEIEPKLSGGLGAVDKKMTSQFKGLMKNAAEDIASAGVVSDGETITPSLGPAKASFKLGKADPFENGVAVMSNERSAGADFLIVGTENTITDYSFSITTRRSDLLFGSANPQFKVRSHKQSLEIGVVTFEKIETYVKMPNWSNYGLIRTDTRYGLGKSYDIKASVFKFSVGLGSWSHWKSEYHR